MVVILTEIIIIALDKNIFKILDCLLIFFHKEIFFYYNENENK